MEKSGLGGFTMRDTIAKEVATIALRDAYPASQRVWGMAITVIGGLTYRLKYNNASVNKSDNGNWVTEISFVGVAAGTYIDMGNWDASGATIFPPAGNGSGAAGVILRGNTFNVSVAPANNDPFGAGATLRAKVDNPGQVVANWSW